jgi:hypothetical protein
MQNQKTTQAVVATQPALNDHHGVEQIALFDSAGNPIPLPQTAATFLLTGYTAHAVGNVAAGDTLLVAIAKLEARIAVLEA